MLLSKFLSLQLSCDQFHSFSVSWRTDSLWLMLHLNALVSGPRSRISSSCHLLKCSISSSTHQWLLTLPPWHSISHLPSKPDQSTFKQLNLFQALVSLFYFSSCSNSHLHFPVQFDAKHSPSSWSSSSSHYHRFDKIFIIFKTGLPSGFLHDSRST